MKTTIKYLLALALIVLVSSTTVSVMTVKPAKPVSVLIENFKYSSYAKDFIAKGVRSGYQLKYIQTNSNDAYNWLVVMEKY